MHCSFNINCLPLTKSYIPCEWNKASFIIQVITIWQQIVSSNQIKLFWYDALSNLETITNGVSNEDNEVETQKYRILIHQL